MITRQTERSKVRRGIRFLNLVLIVFIGSCAPEIPQDAIPPVSFSDIFINLNLPSYQALRIDGGSVYVNGGVRGVIVHRVSGVEFHAYERNCPYQSNEACATVNIHSSSLFMEDPCCGSTFNFSNGSPSGGPAFRALRQYRTILNNTELIITDEVIN